MYNLVAVRFRVYPIHEIDRETIDGGGEQSIVRRVQTWRYDA